MPVMLAKTHKIEESLFHASNVSKKHTRLRKVYSMPVMLAKTHKD